MRIIVIVASLALASAPGLALAGQHGSGHEGQGHHEGRDHHGRHDRQGGLHVAPNHFDVDGSSHSGIPPSHGVLTDNNPGGDGP